MRTLTHTIDLPDDTDHYNLVFLTDTHLGAKACDEKLLQADIDAIKNTPNTGVILGGDYIDAIARVGDKRYDTRTLADWLLPEHDVIGAQVDRFSEMIAPISHQCLAVVMGNHEHSSYRFYGYDCYGKIVKNVAQFSDRKAPDIQLGYQGFVVIKFRRKGKLVWTLTVWAAHGSGGGSMPGGHALALGRVLSVYDCDLIFMGHRHIRQFVDKTFTAPAANGHVRQYLRQGLFVPSYLDSYVKVSSKMTPVDTYSEMKILPPTHLGAVPVRIVPDDKQAIVMLGSKPGLKAAFDGLLDNPNQA